MKAIVFEKPGGPEVLVWSEAPDPVPGDGQVLVEVAAAAVNRADLLQREGNYAPPPGASDILGLECSGRIAALGPGVSGWAWATRCARCWPAGRTRRRSRCPPGNCCRCRRE